MSVVYFICCCNLFIYDMICWINLSIYDKKTLLDVFNKIKLYLQNKNLQCPFYTPATLLRCYGSQFKNHCHRVWYKNLRTELKLERRYNCNRNEKYEKCSAVHCTVDKHHVIAVRKKSNAINWTWLVNTIV